MRDDRGNDARKWSTVHQTGRKSRKKIMISQRKKGLFALIVADGNQEIERFVKEDVY